MASKSRPRTVKVGSLAIPHKVAKLLVGAVIRWEDETPLSNNAEEKLHFYFDTRTSSTTDFLLRRYGLDDVSHVVNLRGFWRISMTIVFRCPNHTQDRHENYTFDLPGTIFPMTRKFSDERDRFYLLQMMHNNEIPNDKKAFGIYRKTVFEAELIGV